MSSQALHLRVGRSILRAETVHAGKVTWAVEATYGDAGEVSDAVARLAAEAPRACRRLSVQLEHPPAQLRTLRDLPPVKPRHLVALVAQQASRFFRKNGRPLVTDAVWVGKGARRIARAAAVEEPLVGAIAVGAREAGLWLETIVLADEPAALCLLPPSERDNRDRAARKRTRRLVAATCGIWLAIGGLFVGRVAWERRAVDRDLAALQEPLAAILEARRELRDAETTLHAIAAAEEERRRTLAVFAAVAGALPDSSVLTSLDWNATGNGVLIGAARRATDVVARLDRLGMLSGVRLGGPAVRESVAGREWERFTILFGREGS
jgi:hypothetical protein